MSSNLFNFNYETEKLLNRDGSESKFKGVFGDNGVLMHTIKGGRYNLIPTGDVSLVADYFLQKGVNVTPFVYNSGEVIGINVPLGERSHVVGDRTATMRMTIRNNGTGVGYISAYINRTICTNGAVTQEFGKENIVKIPHSKDYKVYLDLAQDSMATFQNLIESFENKELEFNSQKLNKHQVMYHLNKWFWDFEFPVSQKPEKMGFNEFRQALAENPESIQCIERYKEMSKSLERELGYNSELNLDLSMYTVYATVLNYTSRRVEKSQSKDPVEVLQERASKKLVYFENLITV